MRKCVRCGYHREKVKLVVTCVESSEALLKCSVNLNHLQSACPSQMYQIKIVFVEDQMTVVTNGIVIGVLRNKDDSNNCETNGISCGF